jgi:hypothetical protein
MYSNVNSSGETLTKYTELHVTQDLYSSHNLGVDNKEEISEGTIQSVRKETSGLSLCAFTFWKRCVSAIKEADSTDAKMRISKC